MAAIQSIVLDLDGKRVELTMEQARKLFSSLDELFGEKTKVVREYYQDYRPWWDRKIAWTLDTKSHMSEGVNFTYDNKSAQLCCKV